MTHNGTSVREPHSFFAIQRVFSSATTSEDESSPDKSGMSRVITTSVLYSPNVKFKKNPFRQKTGKKTGNLVLPDAKKPSGGGRRTGGRNTLNETGNLPKNLNFLTIL
jgi:hypothetical protein